MMVFPEFVVPLTPQDLPAEETYEQINASLSALQRASDGVFTRIQQAVEERRGRLDELLERLKRIEAKISTLSNSNHPLAAQASALYPELDALRSWQPLFPGTEFLGTQQGSSAESPLPLPPELPAEDDGRVRGQDTADLLHFFKQAQATSSAITTQGGPTSIPENLTSATSLLRYGGSRAAFGGADLDSTTDSLPAVSSSITLHKAQAPRRPADLGRPSPPQPFSFQELPVPALQLPRTLPDLDASSQRSSSTRSGSGRPDSASRPCVPWDPALTGRQISQESRSSRAASDTGEGRPIRQENEPSSGFGASEPSPKESAAPEQATDEAELAAGGNASAEPAPEAAKKLDQNEPAGSGQSSAAESERAQGPAQSSGDALGESASESAAQPTAEKALPRAQLGAGGQATNGQATSRQQSQRKPPRSLPPSRGGSAEALDAQGAAMRLSGGVHLMEEPGSVGSQRRFAHMSELGTALDKHVDLGALGGVPSDLEHSIMLRQRSLSSRASMDDPSH